MLSLETIITLFGKDFFVFLRNNYFLPAFQKMALTYSVSTSRFYDTVHDYEYLPDNLENEKLVLEKGRKAGYYYNRAENVYSSYHRLQSIISRLSVADNSYNPHEEKQDFFVPKIFDTKLQETMIFSYNAIADVLGVTKIRNMAPPSHISRSMLDLEETGLTKATIAADYYLPNAGYAVPLSSMDRSGFTFNECAILSCIYLTFYRQAIPTLNKALERDSSKKRARGRLKKALEIIYSKDFYISLCRTALDVISDYLILENVDILQEFIDFEWNSNNTEVHVPNKHLKKPHKASMLSIAEAIYLIKQVFPITELILMGVIANDRNTVFGNKQFFDINIMETDLFKEQYTINPTLDFWDSLMSSPVLDEPLKSQFREGQNHKASEITYWIAKEIAAIINAYIAEVQYSSVELLRCLPEFKDFDGIIGDYLKIVKL